MRGKTLTVFLFVAGFLGLGASLPPTLYAQEGEALLREGLGHFREGRYQQAVSSFRGILFDGGGSAESPVAADAYYWVARSYMALELYEESARNLEFFLSSYANHRLYPEALYQKGRLLFLQGEEEKAILVFDEFLQGYPGHEMTANALYWTGESLYRLGQLDEAAAVLTQVLEDHPQGFKVPDARYRLSLIQFKERENELMKLLKWSHEETLRVTEEFQRREQAYEQAIAVYQQRLSAGGRTAESGASPQAALQDENERLKQRVQALEAQLAGQGGSESAEAALYGELENRRKLLEAKAEALAVKEALLQALAQQVETGQ
ncbi:MAG: tetratricopeptide repeat protein [Spirochaetales bacterium]|nr:tetratricopeptide repeat protein [Spirochaetales bacterium]